MESLRLRQTIIIIVSFALSLATLLLHVPASQTYEYFHAPLFVETFLAGISVGAAALFLTGLSGFKVKLRVAYLLIALGILLYALALIQLPFLQVLTSFNSTYVTEGWLNFWYDLAALLLLVGIMRYASLIQAKSFLLRPVVIIAVTLVVALCTLILPHSGNFYPTISALRTSVWFTTISAMLLTFAAIGFLVVKRAVGPAYTTALAWSFLGVGLLAFSTFSTVYFQLVSFASAYVTSGLFFIPFLIAVFCNLRAAVAFNNITRY
jgi:hypothetical protein